MYIQCFYLVIGACQASKKSENQKRQKYFAYDQGCKMVCFQTKNHNLGKFWRALEWKMLVYVMTIWNILRPFALFMTVCYKLWSFCIFFPRWYVWTKKNLATLLTTFACKLIKIVPVGVANGHSIRLRNM
jgi:hypothetical protein